MKRVQGTKGVRRMECINPYMNKWSVRWDVQDNPTGEGKAADGVNYMEETFLFKPDLGDARSVVGLWLEEREDVARFALDGKAIELGEQGLLFLRDQAERVEKDGEVSVPLVTSDGTLEVSPREALFVVDRMARYLSAHKAATLAKRAEVEAATSIDTLTAIDFSEGYPEVERMTMEEVRTAISNQKPTLQEQAVSFARMAINTVELSDRDALSVKDLHPSWESFVGEAMKAKTRVTYGDKLFRARQDINPVLDIYPPGSQGTEALYEEINETNAGTLDDPIPYNNNMELLAGKYYSQNGAVYKCTRDTGQAVYQDLADLVGIYVEKVE